MWKGRSGGGMTKMWLRSVGGWGRVGSILLLRGSKRVSADFIRTGTILLCLFVGVGDCDRKVDFSFVGRGAGPSCPHLNATVCFWDLFIISGESRNKDLFIPPCWMSAIQIIHFQCTKHSKFRRCKEDNPHCQVHN